MHLLLHQLLLVLPVSVVMVPINTSGSHFSACASSECSPNFEGIRHFTHSSPSELLLFLQSALFTSYEALLISFGHVFLVGDTLIKLIPLLVFFRLLLHLLIDFVGK